MVRRDLDPYAGLKTLLSIWGRWAVRSASRALGYPSVSPMFRDAACGDGYGSQIPLGVSEGAGPDIYRLDEDIKRLPIVQRVAIVEVYQVGGSFREIAGRMGVGRDALASCLSHAYGALSIGIDNTNDARHNSRQSDRVSNSVAKT